MYAYSFYYADLEKQCLPRIDPKTGLLLRYVDDFLLITKESEVAKQFLSTLQRGIPEYNCRVNEEKTTTNFEVLSDGSVKLDDNGEDCNVIISFLAIPRFLILILCTDECAMLKVWE